MVAKKIVSEGNSSPLVSIIMNCYNGEKYLKEAIDSVIAQTYHNWEIIFWDNQSEDSSAEISKSYDDDRIRYFLAPEHTRLGQARDEAISYAQGKYIAFLDVDDLWVDSKLKSQVETLESKNYGLLYSNAEIIFEDGRTNLYSKNKKERFVLKEYKDLGTNYDICISSVIVKSDVIANLGKLFDHELQVSEETELFLRIAALNTVFYESRVYAKYRMYKSSISWNKSEAFISDIEHIINIHRKMNLPVDSLQGITNAAYWVSSLKKWMDGETYNSIKQLLYIKNKRPRIYLCIIIFVFPYKMVLPFLKIFNKKIF